MNCREADKTVSAFINDECSVKEARQFIRHIDNCPSCYRETETYYQLIEAQNILNDESDQKSYNLKQGFRLFLADKKKTVNRILNISVAVVAMLLAAAILVAYFLIFS